MALASRFSSYCLVKVTASLFRPTCLLLFMTLPWLYSGQQMRFAFTVSALFNPWQFIEFFLAFFRTKKIDICNLQRSADGVQPCTVTAQ